jgi:hypothetical protein
LGLDDPVWDRVIGRLLGATRWVGREGAKVGEGMRAGGGDGGSEIEVEAGVGTGGGEAGGGSGVEVDVVGTVDGDAGEGSGVEVSGEDEGVEEEEAGNDWWGEGRGKELQVERRREYLGL